MKWRSRRSGYAIEIEEISGRKATKGVGRNYLAGLANSLQKTIALQTRRREGRRIMNDQARWEQFKREVLGGCVDEELLDSLPQEDFLKFVVEQSDDLAELHQAIQRKNALAQKQGQAI